MHIRLITILIVTLAVTSCTKDNSTSGSVFKEDPNNSFTATFNGKTLKTVGFIFTINGVTDDASGSITTMNAYLLTRNISTGVKTDGMFAVRGSALNLAFGDLYKIPVQQLDASISIERLGNAVGAYKITDGSFPGVYTSSIYDVTVGRKKYDLDPATTTVNITTADALYIQGNYTGQLIDGTTKIPVTGTFKLRKI